MAAMRDVRGDAVLHPRSHVFVRVRGPAPDARSLKAGVLKALSDEFGRVGGQLRLDVLSCTSSDAAAATQSAILRVDRGGLARLRCALAPAKPCPIILEAARSSLISLARSRTTPQQTPGAGAELTKAASAEVDALLRKRARRRRDDT